MKSDEDSFKSLIEALYPKLIQICKSHLSFYSSQLKNPAGNHDQKLFHPGGGLLLYGPVHSGKSTLLRQALRQGDYSHPCLWLSCKSNIKTSLADPTGKSTSLCESLLKKLNSFQYSKESTQSKQVLPVVIFLNVDALDQDLNSENSVINLSALMQRLTFENIPFFATAVDRSNIDSELLLRHGKLDRTFLMHPPSMQMRISAFSVVFKTVIKDSDVQTNEKKSKPSEELFFSRFTEKLAAITPGYIYGDFASLLQKVSFTHDDPRDFSENVMYKEARILFGQERALILASIQKAVKSWTALETLSFVKNQYFQKYCLQLNSISIQDGLDYGDFRGYRNLKKKIERTCEWPLRNPKMFEKMGLLPPTGLILYGPSGCGKTLLARAIGARLSAATDNKGLSINFVSVSAPQLFSKYLGESEKKLRTLMSQVRRLKPCMLFIDEIDALAIARSHVDDDLGVERRMLTTLLSELDGANSADRVFILGCTNKIDSIDSALLRPGRIDSMLEITLPGYDDRIEIIDHYCRKLPLDLTQFDQDRQKYVGFLAAQTENYSGADLCGLCQRVALKALENENSATFTGLSAQNFVDAMG